MSWWWSRRLSALWALVVVPVEAGEVVSAKDTGAPLFTGDCLMGMASNAELFS
jgi:hypothetical protein